MTAPAVHDPMSTLLAALKRRTALAVAGDWCQCGRHRVEGPGALCPVCRDRARRGR